MEEKIRHPLNVVHVKSLFCVPQIQRLDDNCSVFREYQFGTLDGWLPDDVFKMYYVVNYGYMWIMHEFYEYYTNRYALNGSTNLSQVDYKPWVSTDNRAIRIAATVDPPFSTSCFMYYPDKTKCPKPGTEIQFIYTVIAGFLAIPVKWIVTETYDEMEKAVNEGSADILGITYMVTQEYLDNKWIASPIYNWDTVMLIVKEQTVDKTSGRFILFRIFDAWVWVCMFAAFTSMWFINKIRVSNEGIKLWDDNDRSRRPFLSICITMILTIIMGVYVNILSIDLIQPRLRSIIPFEEADEMTDKLLDGSCRLVVDAIYEGDEEFDYWLVNPDKNVTDAPFFTKMRQAFKKNPPLYVDGRQEIVRTIHRSSNKLCYIGVDYYALKLWYSSRFCELEYLTFPKFVPPFGFVYFHKSRDLEKLLDIVMTSEPFTLDNGFQSNLQKVYYSLPYKPGCNAGAANWKPLPLSKIRDSFLILFGAAAGISIFFCLEIFVKYMGQRYIESSISMITISPSTSRIQPNVSIDYGNIT